MVFNAIDDVLSTFFVWCLANPPNKRDVLVVDGLGADSDYYGGIRLQLLRSKGLPQVFLRSLRSTGSAGLVSLYWLHRSRRDLRNSSISASIKSTMPFLLSLSTPGTALRAGRCPGAPDITIPYATPKGAERLPVDAA